MANGFQFTSYDGRDKDGVRAEVSVQKGRGIVKSISPHATAKASNVEIQTEGLQYSQKGWVNNDSDVLKQAQKALDDGTEVEYRFESQRRSKIDRNIPIDDLRLDKDTNQKTVRSILAGINGVYSDEMVTDPDEDPSPDGRISARAQNQSNQNNNSHAAPQGGGNQQNNGGGQAYQNQPTGAYETTPWNALNADRTVNFGSFGVLAATGVETFVRKHLAEAELALSPEDFDRTVYGWSVALLDMADNIQGYITGKTPNRLANSHTRVRGIIFDTIEHIHPFSELAGKWDDRAEWYSTVGRVALNRMRMIADLNRPALDRSLRQQMLNLDEFLGRQPAAPSQQEAPGQEESSNAPQASQNEPKPQANEESGEGVTEDSVMSARPDPALHQEDESESTAGVEALRGMSQSSMTMMPQDHGPVDMNEPDPQTVESLKELMQDSQISGPELGAILNYTFGHGKVAEISVDKITEFVDFYGAAEIEEPGNLRKVVEFLQNRG